jgi:FtsP/CotA-like multicopper oxidase with cupredoxin domain
MTQRTRRLGVVLALAAGSALLVPNSAGALPPGTPKLGMVCTPGTIGPPGTRTFNLVANTGYIETPDGNAIFMWSYANAATPGYGPFQSPGPVLCATQGETVVVNLSNTLPEPTSIVFPGQDAAVTATGGVAGLLTTEAAATSGTVSYSFTALSPGTYVYESGSNPSKQVEMGLYGALVIRPGAGANYAYNTSTQFDPAREYLLLLSEIDPALHHAVEVGDTYDFTTLHNRYFAINGREFPDTVQDNGSSLLPNQPYGSMVRVQPFNATTNPQPALVRMINVGVLNHPFHPHGDHTRQIAQDGRLLTSPAGGDASTEHFAQTVGSGQTLDYLLTWKDQDFWSPTNPLPVAQPNYRNLVFKDGNTYYSGSPYMGYKGTLPTGTVSQNICGEWYFPLHSHALDEFSNFDEAFGGMATLLRVDPLGGCFGFPTSTTLVGGVLKSGSVAALGADDSSYYQVNPKTTTLTAGTLASSPTITVASNSGFPVPPPTYYVRIDNEVLAVSARGGTGGLTWTVARGQLGTAPASHATNATITALANDWYAGFTGVATGAQNLTVTYKGKNCSNTTGTGCTTIPSNLPQQTVKICNWTTGGAAGCSTATSAGWVTLPPPPAQPQSVGSTDVSSTWTLPNPPSAYIGTGANKGQVRVLVHTQRWSATAPTAFSTWGNFMKIVYDAP